MYLAPFFIPKQKAKGLYRREVINIPKNGKVALDWVTDEFITNKKAKVIVVIALPYTSTSYNRN